MAAMRPYTMIHPLMATRPDILQRRNNVQVELVYGHGPKETMNRSTYKLPFEPRTGGCSIPTSRKLLNGCRRCLYPRRALDPSAC